MYERDRESLSNSTELFPSLTEYKLNHTETNLAKLCNDVADFCIAIYASTQTDGERKIYADMINRIQ